MSYIDYLIERTNQSTQEITEMLNAEKRLELRISAGCVRKEIVDDYRSQLKDIALKIRAIKKHETKLRKDWIEIKMLEQDQAKIIEKLRRL